jgi:hypothetical protein
MAHVRFRRPPVTFPTKTKTEIRLNMTTIPAFLLRTAAVSATLFVTSIAFSAESTAVLDLANERLAASGAISVKAVGKYVEEGTFRIQVSTKLGRPSAVLADGTWLYENRTLQESPARGTLVIRFNRGRVSELALVTPSVALALQADPHKPLASYLVATK